MSFFKEFASVLGYNEAKLALGYSYINYNGEAVYAEGIKRIIKIEENVMAFAVKGGVLYVFGGGLKVSELCGESILVKGDISAVETGEYINLRNEEAK